VRSLTGPEEIEAVRARFASELVFAHGDVPAHPRVARPRRLAEIIREVADRVEATPPERGVGGTVGDGGGTIGAFALIDDDEVWQQTMRAQIDPEQALALHRSSGPERQEYGCR
jgi:hypothetical protein